MFQCIKCSTFKGEIKKATTNNLRGKKVTVNVCEDCIKRNPNKYRVI